MLDEKHIECCHLLDDAAISLQTALRKARRLFVEDGNTAVIVESANTTKAIAQLLTSAYVDPGKTNQSAEEIHLIVQEFSQNCTLSTVKPLTKYCGDYWRESEMYMQWGKSFGYEGLVYKAENLHHTAWPEDEIDLISSINNVAAPMSSGWLEAAITEAGHQRSKYSENSAFHFLPLVTHPRSSEKHVLPAFCDMRDYDPAGLTYLTDDRTPGTTLDCAYRSLKEFIPEESIRYNKEYTRRKLSEKLRVLMQKQRLFFDKLP